MLPHLEDKIFYNMKSNHPEVDLFQRLLHCSVDYKNNVLRWHLSPSQHHQKIFDFIEANFFVTYQHNWCHSACYNTSHQKVNKLTWCYSFEKAFECLIKSELKGSLEAISNYCRAWEWIRYSVRWRKGRRVEFRRKKKQKVSRKHQGW